MINSQASSSDCQRPPVTVIASLVKRKKTLFYNQHVNDTTLSLQRPTGLFIYAGRTVVLILYIDVSRCPQCYRLPAPFPVHVPLVAFFTREFVDKGLSPPRAAFTVLGPDRLDFSDRK